MTESLDYKIDAYIRSIDYNLKHDLRRVDDLLLNLEGLEPDVQVAILMHTWPVREILYWRSFAITKLIPVLEKHDPEFKQVLDILI